MSPFQTYFRLGYEHIVNLAGLDHILFIIALMAVYQPKSWLRIIIAIILFTLGHSLSLSLSAFQWVTVDKDLVEFLIPLTILLTALFNLTKAGQREQASARIWLAAVFGLIHGLGFANYYQMLTMGEMTYWSALLPFNLGVEVGHIVIVIIMLLLMVVFQLIFNVRHQSWNLFISGGAFGLSALMCLEGWPF